MQQFFAWLSTLPQLAQIPIVLVAFAAVIALVVFGIEILPRPGRVYSVLRLVTAVGVPTAVLAVLGLERGASWGYLLAAVLGGGLFLLDRRRANHRGRVLQLFLFCSPGFGLIAVGLLYPTVKTIVAAFFDKTGTAYVGLDNFAWLFAENSGTGGLTAVLNTVVWVVVAPVAATAIGLLYAVWVDKARGEKVLKSLVFMPVAISLVSASIIFKFLYDYRQGAQVGLLNQLVVWFGGQPVNWLNSHPLNVALLIVILIWSQTGFAMVILSAAIKGVPEELTEAAQLDGADAFHRFWNVTVPTIRPTIVVVWVTVSITALKVYDIIAVTTAGAQGTTVLGYEMVRQFSFLPPQSGHSAALALVIFVLVIPFIAYNTRNLRAERRAS